MSRLGVGEAKHARQIALKHIAVERTARGAAVNAEIANRQTAVQNEASIRSQAVSDIRNDTRFANSFRTTDTFGGVLSGTPASAALRANTVTQTQIAGGSIGTFQMQANAVGSTEIKLNGVAAGNLEARLLNATHFPFVSGVGDALPGSVKVQASSYVDSTIPNSALTSVGASRVSGLLSLTNIPVLGGNYIADEAIGITKISSTLNGGDRTAYRLRLMGGNGTSGAAASSDHTHSVPFELLEEGTRRRIIGHRKTLRAARFEEAGLEAMRKLVLALAHGWMDHEHADAEEHEWRLAHDARYGREHMRNHRHEYGGRVRQRERGGYYVNPHPDVS